MTLVLLVLAMRMRVFLPEEGPTRVPLPQINVSETHKLASQRRHLFRAPRI